MTDKDELDVRSFLERYSLGPLGWRWGTAFALGSTTALGALYLLGDEKLGSPFVFFVPVVGLAGYMGGLIPGLIATLMSFGVGFTLVPDELFAEYQVQITLRAIACAVSGVLSSWLFHKLQTLVEVLQRSNRVAEVLRSELNHRVGNFLQNVLSYCYMLKLKGEHGGRLEAVIEKLNALGQVHHILQSGEQQFGADIVTQVTAAVLTHHEHQVDIDPRVRLSREQIQPLMLILNEFVSNTAKHSSSNDIVHVRLTRENDHITFIYCDGGPGQPVKGKGLGLRLVEGLVEQLQGTVEFAQAPKATIRFPAT